MIKKILISVLILMINTCYVVAQIGIGTTSPETSAALDVYSKEKGFLVPRLTTEQRNAIPGPREGLIIYNLTEKCLQLNTGNPSNPDWSCIGGVGLLPLDFDCGTNGFEGVYINGSELYVNDVFKVNILNTGTDSLHVGFNPTDLVLSGVSGVSVSAVTPSVVSLAAGESEIVTYQLSGTPGGAGQLIGTWTKLGLTCTKEVEVLYGDANFILPLTLTVPSVYDGTPALDIQGVIDNGVNKYTLKVPYSAGVGAYYAFTGTYVLNNTGTGQAGDVNSFRLSYPAGNFSYTGHINVTIEVDGDGSFNAKKQLFEVQETIASLNFMMNDTNEGIINIDVTGGVLDRNFADSEHKFVYFPVTADDGRVWLNHFLGADYTNMNHPQFNPIKKPLHLNDFYAFGSVYQWGRYSDGHELVNYVSSTQPVGARVYGETNTLSATDTPGHNLFISTTTSPYDWRSSQNDNLWQGVNGINNPCPLGYRLATDMEWLNFAEREGFFNNGITDSNMTSLGLTYSSGVSGPEGDFPLANSGGYYWGSTTYGTEASYYYFVGGSNGTYPYRRAVGRSVRCIKD